MKKKNSVILCEGFNDLIILDCALKSVGWSKVEKDHDEFDSRPPLFINDPDTVNEYTNANGSSLIVHSVGGCENFSAALEEVCERNSKGFRFSHLAIVTDYDDESALSRLGDAIKDNDSYLLPESSAPSCSSYDYESEHSFTLHDSRFEINKEFKIRGVLLPPDEHGAIETFILEHLAKLGHDEEEVVEQVKWFIDNRLQGKVKKFLGKRGKRTKAKLSVTFSIFSPDRVFANMVEYLESLPWEEYEELKPLYEFVS